MYVCYVLISELNHTTYCGVTNNPQRRLRQHNGEITGGAKYTRKFRPWSYAFLIEGFRNRSEAMSFEWQMKNMKNVIGSPLESRKINRRFLLLQRHWSHLT